jgi:hypothetical protein
MLIPAPASMSGSVPRCSRPVASCPEATERFLVMSARALPGGRPERGGRSARRPTCLSSVSAETAGYVAPADRLWGVTSGKTRRPTGGCAIGDVPPLVELAPPVRLAGPAPELPSVGSACGPARSGAQGRPGRRPPRAAPRGRLRPGPLRAFAQRAAVRGRYHVADGSEVGPSAPEFTLATSVRVTFGAHRHTAPKLDASTILNLSGATRPLGRACRFEAKDRPGWPPYAPADRRL